MHQSRLAGFIIDCNVPDLAAAAAFWGAALRMDIRELPAEEGSKYMRLVDPEGRLHIEVQTVTHPSRVHLDIESTDVEAEVVRLEGLGARRVTQVHTWWVMEAPTGQRFCVVRKSTQPVGARALAPHRRDARHHRSRRPAGRRCRLRIPGRAHAAVGQGDHA